MPNGEHEGGGASRTTDPASGSSSATDVSLREFTGMQIGYERQSSRLLVGFITALGAFAWSQIQRRLEILNHENARVATIAEQTVSSDTYSSDSARRDDEREKLDDWRAKVDEKFTQSVTKEEVRQDQKMGQRYTIDTSTKVIAVVIAAAVLLIGGLNYAALHHTTITPPTTVTVTTTVATTTTP